MVAVDKDKALIVANHYPPFCYDGSNNVNSRSCIADGIAAAGRQPDLVISGHSHNYQRIEGSYPTLVIGTGGVASDRVDTGSTKNGPGVKLVAYSGDTYGAVTLTVDANKREIRGCYNVAAKQYGNAHPPLGEFDSFTYKWAT